MESARNINHCATTVSITPNDTLDQSSLQSSQNTANFGLISGETWEVMDSMFAQGTTSTLLTGKRGNNRQTDRFTQ